MEPELRCAGDVHFHWDDDAGWTEVPLGGYCPLCKAVTGQPGPGPGTVVILTGWEPGLYTCPRCCADISDCECGLYGP